MVDQGEYAISITWDQAIYNRIDEGYPLEAVIPEEGVGYDLDVVWMFKNTEKRELVEEVIDYIGSEKRMEKTDEHSSMVTKPDMHGTVEEIEDHSIDYDAVWSEENLDRIMKKWRSKF